MCSKSAFFDFCDFFKDKKSQFSKANFGYLDIFLGDMLESKWALNNLNFKCYIFLSEHELDQKRGGGEFHPPLMDLVWQKAKWN